MSLHESCASAIPAAADSPRSLSTPPRSGLRAQPRRAQRAAERLKRRPTATLLFTAWARRAPAGSSSSACSAASRRARACWMSTWNTGARIAARACVSTPTALRQPGAASSPRSAAPGERGKQPRAVSDGARSASAARRGRGKGAARGVPAALPAEVEERARQRWLRRADRVTAGCSP